MYELYHHGIDGQRWGVRNGPPYPLNREAKNKSQYKQYSTASSSSNSITEVARKRKTRTSLRGLFQSKMYQIDRALIKRGFRGTSDAMHNIGSAYLSDFDDQWEEEEVRVYPNGQKTLNSPADVIRAFLREKNENPYPMPEPVSTKPQRIWEIASGVNPDHGDPGTIQNCTKCSATFVARMLGFNVRAGRMTYPANADAMTYWYDGCSRSNYSSADDAYSAMKRSKIGSFVARYVGGNCGHMMNYIRDDLGRTLIVDGQTGRAEQIYDFAGYMKERGFDEQYGFQVYDMEHATPNWDHMMEDSVIRSPLGTDTRVWNSRTNKVVDTW